MPGQSVVGELVPLAMVVALSPFTIVPAVLLVLHAPRPRATGLMFLAGWLAGLAVTTALFLQLPTLLGRMNQEPQAWTAWLRIGIGALLVASSVIRWLTRNRATGPPRWLAGLRRVTPAMGAAIGLVLVLVNPKVLFVNAAAGLVIGTAGFGAAGVWTAVAGYTLGAGSTVLLPVVAYLAAPGRVDRWLDAGRAWIEFRHAVITAVLLLVIGLILLVQGALST